MKTVLSLLLAGLVGTALSAPLSLTHESKLLKVDGPVIENEYIVVLKDGISASKVESHMAWLDRIMKSREEQSVETRYDIGTFNGYAGKFSQFVLEKILSNSNVQYVEPNGIVTLSEEEDALVIQRSPRSWGLDRLDQNRLPLDTLYHYDSTAGGGVNAFIIDTGIYLNHNDYKGRVSWGANYADSINDDCNGHGTHVAGTVGGTQYGVAKSVTMIAVKVLNCAGSGSFSGIISGVNYVTSRHQSSSNKKTVANMSLGGSKSQALNDAVDSSSNAGVIHVVAAGNEGTDACTKSPASAPTAISIGASSRTDVCASFSNRGSCLEVYAPGVDIVSSYIGSAGAEATMSGTSMAAPHAAGVVACHLSRFGTSTPAAMRTRLQNNSWKNVLTSVPAGTVNYLLNSERPA